MVLPSGKQPISESTPLRRGREEPSAVAVARRMARECAGTATRRASRVLSRMYDDALRPTKLKASQLSVLVGVAMFGDAGAPMGALAEGLLMDPTTLTRNVRPLEKSGLVRVARNPDDARARVLFLTRAGERTLVSALPLWESVQQRVRAALGSSHLVRLRGELDRAVARVLQSNAPRSRAAAKGKRDRDSSSPSAALRRGRSANARGSAAALGTGSRRPRFGRRS